MFFLLKKRQLKNNIFEFIVKSDSIFDYVPGQFVYVLCGGNTFLRRPFSITDSLENDVFRFIFEIRGNGTLALSEKSVVEPLDLFGPLGRGFELKNLNDDVIFIVGGGIGVLPLLGLVKKIKCNCSKANLISILGFQNKEKVLLREEFEKFSNVILVTDDGSVGIKGLVTDFLMNQILKLKQEQVNKLQLFACGPFGMLKSLSKIANRYNIPAQISMEQKMACGRGVCYGCTIKFKNDEYKRVCADGPVFNMTDVDFGD